jgi:hypothetical protein
MKAIIKTTLLLTALLSVTAQASYVAVVTLPKAIAKEPTAQLFVSQESLVGMSGSYSVSNSELFFSDTLISDEGCEVKLTGDEKSGTWEYFNSLGCSDNDSITFLAKGGLVKTVYLWSDAAACNYWENEWLAAAKQQQDFGFGGTGLIYNPDSCSVNGSSIKSLISPSTLPAYFLDSINIDIISGGEGGEGLPPPPPEGEGAGEGSINPEFNLPLIQYVFNDIIVDFPFLVNIDLSNLRYVLGTQVVLRGMQNITKFDLSKLQNYYDSPLDINIMGAMSAVELDISGIQNGGVIDISYTSITDVSKFSRLKFGTIISNNDNELYFPQVTVFPSRFSNFCQGVRWGNITFSSSISQTNADNACQ